MEPNREIDFAFVSCSCRACERAGEAKLRGRVRGVPPHRWASGKQIILLLFAGFGVIVAVVWMYSDRMVPNGCRSRMCNQTFDLNVNIVLSGEATI